MSQFSPNQKVMVRGDAEYAPEELRGQEGLYICPDPSQIGVRTVGKSYDGTDDSGPRAYVMFTESGHRSVLEAWLTSTDDN